MVLEPAAVSTRRGKSEPFSAHGDPPVDPYQLDNYLITSAEGFSPFEQNLGKAPFKDLHGDDIWPALAYTEDGGVHPGKVSLTFAQTTLTFRLRCISTLQSEFLSAARNTICRRTRPIRSSFSIRITWNMFR